MDPRYVKRITKISENVTEEEYYIREDVTETQERVDSRGEAIAIIFVLLLCFVLLAVILYFE